MWVLLLDVDEVHSVAYFHSVQLGSEFVHLLGGQVDDYIHGFGSSLPVFSVPSGNDLVRVPGGLEWGEIDKAQ